MIPLYDHNPTRRRPFLTMLLIAACVYIYFAVQPTGQSAIVSSDAEQSAVAELEFLLDNAAIPREITEGRPLHAEEVDDFGPGAAQAVCDTSRTCSPGKNVYLAILSSMFLHGSIVHLGGNMLFLWIFGNNIEDRRGRATYFVFYLLAGLAATLAHVAIDPSSPIPMIGASGAIAGVMGAYLVLFPNAPIRSLLVFGFFIFFRDISAKWLLGFWFVSQFFIAPNSGVAWMAHVGGFVFGIAVALFWRQQRRPEVPAAPAF